MNAKQCKILQKSWANQLAFAERMLENDGCIGRDANEVQDAINNAREKFNRYRQGANGEWQDTRSC